MQEEMLTKIFEKLVSMESKINSMESRINSMESEVKDIKQNMATKEDIRDLKEDVRHLKEADQAIIKICEKTYQEVENIQKEQKLHSAWLRRLTVDCTQNAVEIDLLKDEREKRETA